MQLKVGDSVMIKHSKAYGSNVTKLYNQILEIESIRETLINGGAQRIKLNTVLYLFWDKCELIPIIKYNIYGKKI